MTITTEQIIAIASVLAALTAIYSIVSKPFQTMNKITADLEKLTEKIDDIKEDGQKQGDMIYQLLSHAATNNNTGEMRRALDEYNEYFRH